MILTVYEKQKDLIESIKSLYSIERFDLDPMYNTGSIHYGTTPGICCDISPQLDFVKRADARNLDFIRSGSKNSIMLDPPFLCGGGDSGKISDKYSSYKNTRDLFENYQDLLKESLRILTKNGIVVFKCQDLANGRTQTFSHCEVYNMATELGFYARDLFILTSKNRMMPSNVKTQQHARKNHCYFWVFEKRRKVNKKP